MTHQTADFYRYASRYSLAEWEALWWQAQRVATERADAHAKRVADQSDCYGKSPAWVAAYYAKTEPQP